SRRSGRRDCITPLGMARRDGAVAPNRPVWRSAPHFAPAVRQRVPRQRVQDAQAQGRKGARGRAVVIRLPLPMARHGVLLLLCATLLYSSCGTVQATSALGGAAPTPGPRYRKAHPCMCCWRELPSLFVCCLLTLCPFRKWSHEHLTSTSEVRWAVGI